MLEWFCHKSRNTGGITMAHKHSNTIEEVRKSGRHLPLDEHGIIQALHKVGCRVLYDCR